jgi:hypothetical protein
VISHDPKSVILVLSTHTLSVHNETGTKVRGLFGCWFGCIKWLEEVISELHGTNDLLGLVHLFNFCKPYQLYALYFDRTFSTIFKLCCDIGVRYL